MIRSGRSPSILAPTDNPSSLLRIRVVSAWRDHIPSPRGNFCSPKSAKMCGLMLNCIIRGSIHFCTCMSVEQTTNTLKKGLVTISSSTQDFNTVLLADPRGAAVMFFSFVTMSRIICPWNYGVGILRL